MVQAEAVVELAARPVPRRLTELLGKGMQGLVAGGVPHLARIQEAYGKPARIGEQATLSCRVGILGQWGKRRNVEALGVVVALWRQKEHQTDHSRRAAPAEVVDDRVVVPGGPLERS